MWSWCVGCVIFECVEGLSMCNTRGVRTPCCREQGKSVLYIRPVAEGRGEGRGALKERGIYIYIYLYTCMYLYIYTCINL